MERKKKVYFHIGTHKTGTTALQSFFVKNRNVLSQNGIQYENYHEVELNQGFLINQEAWKSVHFDPLKNHLISSEDFYHRIIQLSDTVKQSLSDFDIHFIIYLKRQDLMKESVYNQIVKMAGFCGEIQEDNHYNLDYYNFLISLKEKYPAAAVTVRPYEKEQFNAGTIFSDFLDILGLKLTDEYQVEKGVVNPSLARDKLEFARLINMLNFPLNIRQNINRQVVRAAVDSNEVSMFRTQNVISPSDATNLLAKYDEGNKRIAKEFLGRDDGRLFYLGVDSDLNWKPYPGLTKEVLREILLKIREINNNFLEDLYSYIESSQERNKLFCKSANFLMPLLKELSSSQKEFTPYKIDSLSTMNYFKEIENKLSENSESADILREVAFAFEKIADIETAHKVMQKALALRPEGPVIKQKLDEYIAKLAVKE